MIFECAYCGSVWKEISGCCSHCGAPNKISKLEKYDSFDYEGYIVYVIRDWPQLCMRYIFYKGRELVGKVVIDDREMLTWNPSYDPMPMILERLKNEQSSSA